MIYTGKRALKQLSILFDKSIEDIETEINNTSQHNWTTFSFEIETPTYLRMVNGVGEEDALCDDVFSLGIYMDRASDFLKENNVTWKNNSHEYFPNPQIDYCDTHINMFKEGEYITFDTSILANELKIMIDYEKEVNYKFNFKIYVCDKLINTIKLSQMEKIIYNFINNQENADAIQTFISDLKNS